MRITACMTPVLNLARSNSHITRNFTVTFLPPPSTDPRQRVSDQHVYHARTTEPGVHEDHARRLLTDLADDRGFFTALDVPQLLQGSVRRVRGNDGEELAFVGDVEGVYPQDLARPVHHIPDREPLLPKSHTEPRVAGEFV